MSFVRRLLAGLLAVAGGLLSSSTASADCDPGPLYCCYGYPILTGTVVDAGPEAQALLVDWTGQGATAKVGEVVPLLERTNPVGTRQMVREDGPPLCPASGQPQRCPYYLALQELDGGSYTCSILTEGRPSVSLGEEEFIALNARADCYETLKARLGLAGKDLCEGASLSSCRPCSVPAASHDDHAALTPIAFGGALATLVFWRSRARTRRRAPRKARAADERRD